MTTQLVNEQKETVFEADPIVEVLSVKPGKDDIEKMTSEVPGEWVWGASTQLFDLKWMRRYAHSELLKGKITFENASNTI